MPEIRKKVEAHSALILQASPGSGKTTRVPPALLGQHSQIIVLEPRRLAAKYAARRVAEEMGEIVGKTVGYQFRFENVSSAQTRLRFLTEGMLMRRMLSDPHLKGVTHVILDEFHERHLHTDVALGYLKWLQSGARRDLKLVVMSATLETENLSRFLGDAPVMNIDAPAFPVEVSYLPSAPSLRLETLVREAVTESMGNGEPNMTSGHTLVFLPGMAEIRRCEEALASLRDSRGIAVYALHGELSREEQDHALERSTQRKIILATNVAETSLTIEGVTMVIDSGLHRQASYSWWSGVPALKTKPISRASAIQRAGRAGRTAPGRCLRLYPKGDYDSRTPFETPEIRRADLSQSLLEIFRLGMKVTDFPWFEPPETGALKSAKELLYLLGAVTSTDDAAALTDLGRRMIEIPAHPRISRILVEAESRKVLSQTADLVTLLSEGDLSTTDALASLSTRLNPLQAKARGQLLRSFDHGSGEAVKKSDTGSERDIAMALLTGFPDRVARKKSGAETVDLLFSFGGAAKAQNCGVIAENEFFVVLDVQERKYANQHRAELKVQCVIAIEPDWLFDLKPTLLQEVEILSWDETRQRAYQLESLRYGELSLSESRSDAPPTEKVAAFVFSQALSLKLDQPPVEWISRLPIESSLARIELARKKFPKLELPDVRSSAASAALSQMALGKNTAEALQSTDWENESFVLLAGQNLSLLERLVPSSVSLPSGRKTKVNYSLEKGPWIESRLQDFFGMKSGPALLDGRLPLILHLLAPNYRAVQVTTDLAGFWAREYPALRRELGRRYPRHKWPEDPLKPVP